LKFTLQPPEALPLTIVHLCVVGCWRW